jgi:hypothetical protein
VGFLEQPAGTKEHNARSGEQQADQGEGTDDSGIWLETHGDLTVWVEGSVSGSSEPRLRKWRTAGFSEWSRSQEGLPVAPWVRVAVSRKIELVAMAKMLASSWVTMTMVESEAVPQAQDQVVEPA